MTHRLRIGTRGSDLALWQANFVAQRLATVDGGAPDIITIQTRGDSLQGVPLHEADGIGFFTTEVEAALRSGEVDVAVHSYKDLPIEEPEDLTIAAVPERGAVRDVLVARQPGGIDALPRAARVGTSSLRRRAQLRTLRSSIDVVDLRGNVPTRFDKVVSGELDGVVLAEAGLKRLELHEAATKMGVYLSAFDVSELCPAPSQGALAIQVRRLDERARSVVASLNHPATATAVHIERNLLSRFGGGCQLPLGVHCRASSDGGHHLFALICSPDGSERIAASGDDPDAKRLVAKVHAELLRQGAERYL